MGARVAADKTSDPPLVSAHGGELAVSGGFGLQSRSEPLSNMRQVIASRLVESKQTVPHAMRSLMTIAIDVSFGPVLSDQFQCPRLRCNLQPATAEPFAVAHR